MSRLLPKEDSGPLHAQRKTRVSSSWLDQTPNFRQEIRQSHYRNNPVKYDLGDGEVMREYKLTFQEFSLDFLFENLAIAMEVIDIYHEITYYKGKCLINLVLQTRFYFH